MVALGHRMAMWVLNQELRTKYQQLDVLVNNAAIAFKAADPTPFKDQTVPTPFRSIDGGRDG